MGVRLLRALLSSGIDLLGGRQRGRSQHEFGGAVGAAIERELAIVHASGRGALGEADDGGLGQLAPEADEQGGLRALLERRDGIDPDPASLAPFDHAIAYVPELESAGYTLRIREPDWYEHRLFKGPDTNVNVHTFS